MSHTRRPMTGKNACPTIRTAALAADDVGVAKLAYNQPMPPAAETIRKTPDVCGGAACVRDTRIPVWSLQQLRELGRSDAQLLADFPTLLPEDLHAVWRYVRDHRSEVHQAIRQQHQTPQAANQKR